MKRLIYWLPVAAWMACIFLLSSRERVVLTDEATVNFIIFKTLHVIEYFILYILTYRATRDRLQAFIITILYAMSDEFHQTLVPTREGKVRDVIIDAFGATLAWYSIKNILPTLPKGLKSWAKHWDVL